MVQTHFEGKLEALKQKLLAMSHEVEKLVGDATELAGRRSDHDPKSIIEADRGIDETEVTIEETAIELLALHQPMASDLRVIVTILKINNDLERIGDHAVNIAQAVGRLREGRHYPSMPPELPEMSRMARAMLRDALDAFLRADATAAVEVLRRDDHVDALQESLFRVMLTHMLEEEISACLQVILIGRNLERIADLATNVAEDVIYMVRGQTIRHARGLREPAGS
ncbi:MAG: phosphate signaling complex protein PhoU [Candidatus Palauibacterales bacterium]|nr:phosphate signaling complex protein PhoU [Candidatus Palauibacterales bacterium]MDP2529747.1 phosphate signaling complex protein PhoU [Candidatus Palauibacterales bacterium]MDP2585102.1 phosphate signaling complex protein PhoU [Candidatus Palauibacterales bacterium]